MLDAQPETRDPKVRHKTRDTSYKWNPEPTTQNPKSGTQDPWTHFIGGTQNPKLKTLYIRRAQVLSSKTHRDTYH